MTDDTCEITRIAEPTIFPNENRVDVNYTIFIQNRDSDKVRTLAEKHPMRHFSLPELDLLAFPKGFKRLVAEEFLTGNAPSDDTWGVCIVLRKD